MVEAFHDGQIGVMQLDVLAHEGDGAGLGAGGDPGQHLFPLGEVGRGNIQMQLFDHHVVEAAGVEHQRTLVEAGHGQVLDDALRACVAEGADLPADVAAHAAVARR